MSLRLVTVTIRCENAAFRDDDDTGHAEVARILRELADRVVAAGHDGQTSFTLAAIDYNGNTVGSLDALPERRPYHA